MFVGLVDQFEISSTFISCVHVFDIFRMENGNELQQGFSTFFKQCTYTFKNMLCTPYYPFVCNKSDLVEGRPDTNPLKGFAQDSLRTHELEDSDQKYDIITKSKRILFKLSLTIYFKLVFIIKRYLKPKNKLKKV